MASASIIVPAPLGHGFEQPGVDQVPEQPVMTGPMVWHGSQFVDDETFVVELTKNDIAEVDKAVAAFEGESLHILSELDTYKELQQPVSALAIFPLRLFHCLCWDPSFVL